MYAIFPVWFRIIEVSMIGIFYGFIFFRFGIIPLIVSHYLFNVFWGSADYIFGRSDLYLFLGSIGCLAIPLVFAAAAYLLNKKDEEKQIKLALDKTQEYNLQMLVIFISAKKSQGYSSDMIKKELIHHNWEHLLIDLAIEEVFGRRD